MSTATKTQAGTTDVAPASGPSATQQATSEAIRLGKRWRKQALPFVAIGATHGVGAASAALAGPVALLPVAAGWVGAAGAYGYAHSRMGRWGRVYAGIAAVGSAMFQAGIGAAGWDSGWAAALWIAGGALSLPWWVRHSEPDPDVTAELAAAEATKALPAAESNDTKAIPEEQPKDPRQELWDEHLGAAGTAIPGSSIDELDDFGHGWKATVSMPIRGHWKQAFAQREQILSVYDLPDNRVYIESHPDTVRKARMTVLTSSPLQEPTLWTGPTLDPATGKFRIMLTEDGQWLYWKLWNPGAGGLMGLLSGVTRSGKTGGLDVILTECAMSDRIEPLVIDGGGGASLPQWANRVKLFARTPDEARKVLRYALARMEARRPILERQGGGSLEPRPGMPLLPVIMDEAHKRLISDDDVDNTDIVRMCEQITQEGAKFAVILIFANQSPILKQLGNSNALRDQVTSGNVIGLRTTEKRNEGMIVSGDPLPESLRDLPAEFPNGTATHGLGYSMVGRKIRARITWLKNPLDWPVTKVEHEPEASRVPLPRMGEPEPSQARQASDSGSADDAVAHALANGCAKNVAAVMQATGLNLAQAKAALKNF